MAEKNAKLVKVTAAKTFQCMGVKGVLMVKPGEEVEISESEAKAAEKAGVLANKTDN
jgi:hypothetical protein